MANQQPTGFKEFLRKRVVALKRKPQTIALLVLAIAFIFYSLNLTQFSNTTARINRAGMGLCEFATMLFSILSMVCFLNSFPHRQKVKIPMLVLLFVMIAIVLYSGVHYEGKINEYLAEGNATFDYITRARSILHVHRWILAAAAALTALLPVYTPLLRKINTNIEIEGNKGMGAIDISGEDA